MEDLVETLTRGNPAEVKTVLATVALALAAYQLVMAAVGYGRLRLGRLDGGVAFRAHRAVGDTIALLMLMTGVMCLSVYGFEEPGHAAAGSLLLGVLAFKVAVVRRDFGLGRYLPVLGVTVFALLVVTWSTSAAQVLA